MKSVLISIQPKWCELIASGKKTVEVRKNRPKLETPFKVYIYCTQKYYRSGDGYFQGKYCGKVIGEFVCDAIDYFSSADSEWAYMVAPDGSEMPMHEDTALRIMQEKGWLSLDDIISYFGDEDYKAYFWHISNLVIYDKPRELREFKRFCDGISGKIGCRGCKYYYEENDESQGHFEMCGCDNLKPLTRPPQSWMFIEIEVQGE